MLSFVMLLHADREIIYKIMYLIEGKLTIGSYSYIHHRRTIAHVCIESVKQLTVLVINGILAIHCLEYRQQVDNREAKTPDKRNYLLIKTKNSSS